MGPAMNNLDNLVQLPTGCGEQNMIKFAPLVSVTKYLRDTAQLNSKVSELAKEYLKIGNYQTET
jgi:alpha-2-macroglobulin-like protein